MSSIRIFYQVLGMAVSPSPSTGVMWSSGVLGSTGSGTNLVTQLQRIQSCTNGWSANRENIIQWGQLGALDRVIIQPLSSNLSASWYVADLSNEQALGFALNSGQGILNNIINETQDDRNYFIAVAPQGTDEIAYTGQSQVIEITNGYLNSYTTEGRVGTIPTASITVEGYNWATLTGSLIQQSQAVEPISGSVVTGIFFSLPQFTTGNIGSTSVIRPAEINVNIGNSTIGLDPTDLKIQGYNLSFNLNRENLLKLGTKYPYSKVIRFPVSIRAQITAYWGNLLTGSINNLFCADSPYALTVTLYQPCSTVVAAQYTMTGMKLDTQELSNLAVGDIASLATLTFDGTIGSASSSQSNFTMTGIV